MRPHARTHAQRAAHMHARPPSHTACARARTHTHTRTRDRSHPPARPPTRLCAIEQVAAFVNFEVGYVGHQCRYPASWTEVSLFYWQLAFPFLAVALSSGWWLVKAGYGRLSCARSCRERAAAREREEGVVHVIRNKQTLASMFHTPERFADYVWIKFLKFFLTGYPVLVYTAFSIFPCQADADGALFLVNMPAVACYGPDHWTMIFVAVAYIPAVLVAVPVVLCRRLVWGLKADLLNRCAFMECYGWIYARCATPHPTPPPPPPAGPAPRAAP